MNNSASGRKFYDDAADKKYSESIQTKEKGRKVANSEIRAAFKTFHGANPSLNLVHNRKLEIAK